MLILINSFLIPFAISYISCYVLQRFERNKGRLDRHKKLSAAFFEEWKKMDCECTEAHCTMCRIADHFIEMINDNEKIAPDWIYKHIESHAQKKVDRQIVEELVK